ncbi:MAG: DMT family transporter [Chitinophagaceae bacterium]|nr:MAG: DMT family transporter [Chitinophagaceae bacterium]
MRKAFLQLHAAVFLAGFTGVLGHLITLNEGMLVWYRLLFTSLIMWLIFGLRKKIRPLPVRTILRIGGVGFIAAMHWITFYASIKYSNVSVALVTFSSLGFFTAVFEPMILRKRVNRLELLFGLLTIGGIAVIFHFDTEYKTGIILGLISGMLAALFPIFNRQFLQEMNSETMLTWQQTGALLSISVFLPFYLQWFPAEHFLIGRNDFFWMMILVVFCSVIAFQFSSYALKRLSAFTVNISFNLEPVYGILMAFVLFHENKDLNAGFYLGFSIILLVLLVHVLLLVRDEKRKRRAAGI